MISIKKVYSTYSTANKEWGTMHPRLKHLGSKMGVFMRGFARLPIIITSMLLSVIMVVITSPVYSQDISKENVPLVVPNEELSENIIEGLRSLERINNSVERISGDALPEKTTVASELLEYNYGVSFYCIDPADPDCIKETTNYDVEISVPNEKFRKKIIDDVLLELPSDTSLSPGFLQNKHEVSFYCVTSDNLLCIAAARPHPCIWSDDMICI